MTRLDPFCFCLLLLLPAVFSWYPLRAEEAALTGNSPVPVIGENQLYFAGPDDTLIQLARAAGLGYEALVTANPEIDPWLPETGRTVLLPYATILPPNAWAGITVNLAEFRLYYVWQEDGRYRARTYPVGIGIKGWETPEGEFTIKKKIEKPTWVVPSSIRKERPELGRFVPPGPDNPLGGYWLGLSASGYGIHGTNEPFGVGRRVSHGCIRLYPEDIRDLFARVEIGTPVRVIYQPIKVGLKQNALFVEVHPDRLGRAPDPIDEVIRQKTELGWQGKLDWAALWKGIKEARGIPLQISGH